MRVPYQKTAALLLAALYLLPMTGCISRGKNREDQSRTPDESVVSTPHKEENGGQALLPESGIDGQQPGDIAGGIPGDAANDAVIPGGDGTTGDAMIPGVEENGDTSGSTHAGQQPPAQDHASSAGNAMSGQMDNSVSGSAGDNAVPDSSVPGDSDTQSTAQNGPNNKKGNAAPHEGRLSLPAAVVAAAPRRDAQTVTPAAGDFLVVVNDAHRLAAGYEPPLAAVSGSEKKLHRTAAAALEQMMTAAAAEGCPLHLVSGYRSVKYQQGLFERKVKSYTSAGFSAAEAEAAAAKWVARPGASEHSLGLAADIVSGDWYLTHDDLTQDFEDTAAFAWLRAHAAQYGFILRYPAGKEAVTGVHYEPWHWRYVGEAAAAIAASGLCLEEWTAN